MSPSVVVYQDRHEPFKDANLFAVVALLENFLEQGKVPPALQGVVSSWKRSCEQSGPGTIVLDFSEVETNATLHDLLAAALAFLEREVARTWSDTVPPEVMNRYPPKIMEFGPFPVPRLVDAVRRLRHIVGLPIE